MLTSNLGVSVSTQIRGNNIFEGSSTSQEQFDQLKALNYTYGCPGMQSDAVPGPRIHGDLNFEKDGFADTYF